MRVLLLVFLCSFVFVFVFVCLPKSVMRHGWSELLLLSPARNIQMEPSLWGDERQPHKREKVPQP